MPQYLADTSIWGWARSGRRPDIEEKLAARLLRDEIVICAPVTLELMHRATSGEEYEMIYETLVAPLNRLALSDGIGERAIAVQREMARATHGNHLRPANDFLIAAIAEAAENGDVILWFLDKDMRIICEQTGQAYEAES